MGGKGENVGKPFSIALFCMFAFVIIIAVMDTTNIGPFEESEPETKTEYSSDRYSRSNSIRERGIIMFKPDWRYYEEYSTARRVHVSVRDINVLGRRAESIEEQCVRAINVLGVSLQTGTEAVRAFVRAIRFQGGYQ